jgi:hypothetical protein
MNSFDSVLINWQWDISTTCQYNPEGRIMLVNIKQSKLIRVVKLLGLVVFKENRCDSINKLSIITSLIYNGRLVLTLLIITHRLLSFQLSGQR